MLKGHGRSSHRRTRAKLERTRLAQCQRYDVFDHVKWMDVVNETVTTRGRWFGPKQGTDSWENPWTIIGYDETHPLMPPLYIKIAFEIATQHAPNTKLIINQHGGMEDRMWLTIKDLVTIYVRRAQVDGSAGKHILIPALRRIPTICSANELINYTQQ